MDFYYQNFPNGVSPVTSAIFSDIQISGTMSNSAYQIEDGTYIPYKYPSCRRDQQSYGKNTVEPS